MSIKHFSDQERDEIMDKIIENWGGDSQKLMAIEEMAELTQALSKTWRDLDDPEKVEKNRTDVCGEIADVLITVGQMRKMFGAEEVDKMIDLKLQRVSDRLGKWLKENSK